MKTFTLLKRGFVAVGLIATCAITANNIYKDKALLSSGYGYTAVNNLSNNLTKIKLYPSPAIDKLHVEFPWTMENSWEIKVFNVTGKCVYETKEKAEVIDVSTYTPGYYFVQFNNGDQSIVKKIQKIN